MILTLINLAVLCILLTALLIYIIRMNGITASFDKLLMKFIEVNQQFYDSQKNITKRISDIIILMNKDNSEAKELLKTLKNIADVHDKILTDVSGKQSKILLDIKSVSMEIRSNTKAASIKLKNT